MIIFVNYSDTQEGIWMVLSVNYIKQFNDID